MLLYRHIHICHYLSNTTMINPISKTMIADTAAIKKYRSCILNSIIGLREAKGNSFG